MLACTATGLLRTLASMTAPCSVKALGKTGENLRPARWSQFATTSAFSLGVSLNMKSRGKRRWLRFNEPKANWNLRNVKKLTRKRDHAVDEIRFNDGFANFSLAGLIGGHGAIGEHKPRDAVGREMMNKVLDPGKIGVAGGRSAIFPANVFGEAGAAPIAIVEGWIGEDEIGFEVFVCVVVKGAFAVPGDIGLDATNGEIHFAEAPSG